MTQNQPQIRVGFIGAGFIADYHAAVLRASNRHRLVWVADQNQRRADALRDKRGFERSGVSAATLLSEFPVDVVHILVPPPLHAAAAEMAIRAGASVLIEKPMAASYAECRSIADLARARGVVAGVNHNALFQPAFQALVRRIRRGDLGAVEHVIASWNMPLPQLESRQFDHWMFAQPLNIVLEQAVHPLSQVQFLLGEIGRVSAQSGDGMPLPTGVRFFGDWNVSIIAARGTAQCHLGFGHSFFDHWLHVTGEDGAAFADLRRNTLRVTTKGRQLEPVDNLIDGWRSATGLVRSATSDFAGYAAAFLGIRPRQDAFYVSMAASIHAFYDALDASTEPPASAEFAARLVKVCEEIAKVGDARHDAVLVGAP